VRQFVEELRFEAKLGEVFFQGFESNMSSRVISPVSTDSSGKY